LWFGRGGENLTYALRVKLFEAYLSKHIGWFDNKNRAPGILTNILTEDISAVNGLTTESVGIAVEAALGLFFSCLICFIFSWKLGFVVTFTSPFMVLGGLGMSKLQFNQKAVDDSYKQANALLNDLIMNYRTVISFGEKNVQFMLSKYGDLLVVPHQTNLKRAHISGLFFGYS
jgi:ABC-type multidrug transport system fused ATPase/permease subunit